MKVQTEWLVCSSVLVSKVGGVLFANGYGFLLYKDLGLLGRFNPGQRHDEGIMYPAKKAVRKFGFNGLQVEPRENRWRLGGCKYLDIIFEALHIQNVIEKNLDLPVFRVHKEKCPFALQGCLSCTALA